MDALSFFLGGLACFVFLVVAWVFFCIYRREAEGMIKNLVLLEGSLSLAVFLFSFYFFVLEKSMSLSMTRWYLLLIFVVWSALSHYIFALSRSFGFKNTPYFRRVVLEMNVSGFFGKRGYASATPAEHLLRARLVTSSGTLSKGVTIEHMRKRGHLVKLERPSGKKKRKPRPARKTGPMKTKPRKTGPMKAKPRKTGPIKVKPRKLRQAAKKTKPKRTLGTRGRR